MRGIKNRGRHRRLNKIRRPSRYAGKLTRRVYARATSYSNSRIGSALLTFWIDRHEHFETHELVTNSHEAKRVARRFIDDRRTRRIEAARLRRLGAELEARR